MTSNFSASRRQVWLVCISLSLMMITGCGGGRCAERIPVAVHLASTVSCSNSASTSVRAVFFCSAEVQVGKRRLSETRPMEFRSASIRSYGNVALKGMQAAPRV